MVPRASMAWTRARAWVGMRSVSSGSVISLLLVYQPGVSLVLVLRCEVVLEQAVDEDVAAADFAQEDALGGVVEEADQVPGDIPADSKKKAKDTML